MGKKVTIVGAGSVGSTIAYTMAVAGIATEVVMIDINDEKAMGEALDIRQGVAFCPPITIYAGGYQDAQDSDIVVVCSGVARKPGQSRLDLAQTNVNITKAIAKEIVKYAPNAIYVIVANPVDILTYVFAKVSGLPERQIIGSGTILDTARLRARIAEYYNISQQNVHAYVLGEHGDTSFVPWSMGTISNIAIDHYSEALTNKDFIPPTLVHDDVENYIRKSGGKIIARKGAGGDGRETRDARRQRPRRGQTPKDRRQRPKATTKELNIHTYSLLHSPYSFTSSLLLSPYSFSFTAAAGMHRWPPSTSTFVPVTNDAASEQR